MSTASAAAPPMAQPDNLDGHGRVSFKDPDSAAHREQESGKGLQGKAASSALYDKPPERDTKSRDSPLGPDGKLSRASTHPLPSVITLSRIVQLIDNSRRSHVIEVRSSSRPTILPLRWNR